MAGAVRFITGSRRACLRAGLDFDSGQIQGQGDLVRGLCPTCRSSMACWARGVGLQRPHGGLHDNALTTRTWKNSTGLTQRLGP
jgi:hypothetical protein